MMNPLSDFFITKDGTRISTSMAVLAKIRRFCKEFYGVKAITNTGEKITLGDQGAKLENVDFVAGLWRVQTQFPYKITRVRDKDMVLIKKINHKENTGFEYWTAKLVGYNCYGAFIIEGNDANFIVSRCITDKGEFWGYGPTIESARAFLGLKIWDELREVIHAAVFSEKTK